MRAITLFIGACLALATTACGGDDTDKINNDVVVVELNDNGSVVNAVDTGPCGDGSYPRAGERCR